MESTVICTSVSNTRKRRKQKKKKKCFVELKRSKKRKLSKTVEEEGRGVASHFDKPVACLGPSVNMSSDSTHVGPKRAKTAIVSAVGAAKSVIIPDTWDVDSGFSSENSPPASGRSSPCVGINPSMLVAVDCEMPVTDYRTRWSGIKKKHLIGALPFEEARSEILHILQGKVIVGHALHNDFRALGITVPYHMVRDTSCMSLLRQMCGVSEKVVSLKRLASVLLKRNIQVGRQGHCSVEDSRAALDLYKLVEDQWEKSLPAHVYQPKSGPEPASSLEHYMQDKYWPDSITDCNQ